MKTPLKIIALTVSSAVFTLSSSFAVETDPVGYVSVDISGTGGSSSESFTFIAFPFVNAPEAVGVATSVGSSTVANSGAGWSVDQFASNYFVEITSGAAAGTASQVISNTADALTLADDLSLIGLSVDDSFVIRAFTTIGSFFGDSKADVEALGIVTGANPALSDQILIPNGLGGYTFYFFNSSTSPVLGGWRSTTAPTTDASSTAIVPGGGFIYKRVGSEPLSVVSSGTVQTQVSMLNGVDTGFNFVSSNFPVDATLLSFFGADGVAAGLTGAANPALADKIIVPNGAGGYTFYYYNTSTSPVLGGWRSTTAPTTDAKDAVIASAGSSFIIQRLGDGVNLEENRPFSLSSTN